jgi:hypothetical protein
LQPGFYLYLHDSKKFREAKVKTQTDDEWFSRFVPFKHFSFLGSGHGWHDRWSDTRVVRTRGV